MCGICGEFLNFGLDDPVIRAIAGGVQPREAMLFIVTSDESPSDVSGTQPHQMRLGNQCPMPEGMTAPNSSTRRA